MPTLHNTSGVLRAAILPGMEYLPAACHTPNLQPTLAQVHHDIVVTAKEAPITTYLDAEQLFQRINTVVCDAILPQAAQGVDVSNIQVFERNILPIFCRQLDTGDALPIPTVFHAWWCPKRECGLLDAKGTTGFFWNAFDTAITHHRGNSDHDFPIAFG
ncbi:hypothetical protein V8E36_006067 [Tilletia maclaganii]